MGWLYVNVSTEASEKIAQRIGSEVGESTSIDVEGPVKKILQHSCGDEVLPCSLVVLVKLPMR
ncbi:hypothetical protein SNOG_00034 [Parastagonospora nodorum SN15]|uniref:Uncharacterized protein n=1 Tax=Phaeosphaeria nodorum (strain SN15 / ATCC MYA-4574 / FGSC 10173) TaxID=321614 RepID=Q0V7I0_PHANO|nr:hypothetical protein SNOG_00034 [Parastagonospora nodorum SN15]EAT91529.1 hypothetical protein SNOG_00034 [Parastagonospora nodorum SN15]